ALTAVETAQEQAYQEWQNADTKFNEAWNAADKALQSERASQLLRSQDERTEREKAFAALGKELSENAQAFLYAQQSQDLRYLLASENAYGGAGNIGMYGLQHIDADELKSLREKHNIDLILNDSESGYQAWLFRDLLSGQIICAFRGTDAAFGFAELWKDVKTDIKQAGGWGDRQYELAIKLAKELKIAFKGKTIVFTGHSLGGGLAAAASRVTGFRAVTFNAAGLHEKTLQGHVVYDSKIKSYVVSGEILNLAQDWELQRLLVNDITLGITGFWALPDSAGERAWLHDPDSWNIFAMHTTGSLKRAYLWKLRQEMPLQ
ncbi:MAG: hypothetical protein PVH19_13365, partial [Planctomycetia bacterium]